MDYSLYQYGYLGLAAALTALLVYKAKFKDKLEHFFIGFFLMTGEINTILTFKIPGLSFFEIQPVRFLFFVLLFYILRKILFSKGTVLKGSKKGKIPWFMIFLLLNITFVLISQIINIQIITGQEVVVYSVFMLNFLVLIYALRILLTKSSIDFLGKTIIIGAMTSCFISYVQFGLDPAFMRIGDFRGAFGDFLRSNGLFKTEYFNAYFLIAAIVWTLATMRNNLLKYGIIIFLSSGVFLTFHRMSWLVLAFIILVYFIKFERPSYAALSFMSLGGVVSILMICMLFFNDIMNSTLVKERLTDHVDGRAGYYTMVFNNIGDQPIWGFGSKENEIYFQDMMLVTSSRDRATGAEGDIHSGYFQTLFFYGIPAFLCFVGFVLCTVWYFEVLSRQHLFFAIPFLVAVLFLFANLTNTLLFDKYVSTLLAFHIGIGWGARYLTEFRVNE